MTEQDEFKLILSPKRFIRAITNAYNTEEEWFERGKQVQLEQDKIQLARLRELGWMLPLDDRDLGRAIQDILDTAITVDNDCNEITKKTQLLVLLRRRMELAKKEVIEEIEGHMVTLNDGHIVISIGEDSHLATKMYDWWQALKGDSGVCKNERVSGT